MLNNFFGENYKNRVDIFSSLYGRIIFLRGCVFDFPLLILIFYMTPWDLFYSSLSNIGLIEVMENNFLNISENRKNSDFPEYAVSYLSLVHFIGIFSLILPFIYLDKSKSFEIYLEKSKVNKFILIICGCFSVSILFFGNLYLGAISYFNCHECSYHNKFSLVIGALIIWICIHYMLTGMVVFCKTILFMKRNN